MRKLLATLLIFAVLSVSAFAVDSTVVSRSGKATRSTAPVFYLTTTVPADSALVTGSAALYWYAASTTVSSLVWFKARTASGNVVSGSVTLN